MVDPKEVCLYIPDGLKKFKLDLFERIGKKITAAGGSLCRGKPIELNGSGKIPIVGCSPELTPFIRQWRESGRKWIYWDRGYARRVFATWNPRGEAGGYYRWHINSFQMQQWDPGCPDDRWKALNTPIAPWAKNPNGHYVVALLTPTYTKFHDLSGWTDKILRKISIKTKRQIVVRDKESERPLQEDLKGAYCLITHGSMTAVESVMMGCPVVVHPDSAAALVGLTDLDRIDHVVYPDRKVWLNNLAYTQFNEDELVDGTLWRMIK